MLYANLLMFRSYSVASQCCSLQPLSFTGFLKGYFIACHYHSLWLYGLCSPLARSPGAAAAARSPPRPCCLCSAAGTGPTGTSLRSSLRAPRISPVTLELTGGRASVQLPSAFLA